MKSVNLPLMSPGRSGARACLVALCLASPVRGAEPATKAPAAAQPVAAPASATPSSAAATSSASAAGAPGEPPAQTSDAAAAPAPSPAGTATPSTKAAPGSPLNPAPAEFAKAASLQHAELDQLLSRAAALRSRIAALSSALFSSKLRIDVHTLGEGARLKALNVSLDGGVVYTAPPQAFFERPEVVFEHAVAPGAHVVTVQVERHDVNAPQFSTWQESRFVVLVPEQRLLWTRLTLEDESSMAEDFAEDESGSYELSVELQAEVAP